LLGKEQHGNVAAVGFELYAQMLEETVRELKAALFKVQIEPDIQIGLPAYIPEAYIPDVNQRLVFYKNSPTSPIARTSKISLTRWRIVSSTAGTRAHVIEVMDLRRVLREYLVAGVYRRADKVTLHFHPDAAIKGERLVAFVQKNKGRSQLSPDLRLTFFSQTRRRCDDSSQDAFCRR